MNLTEVRQVIELFLQYPQLTKLRVGDIELTRSPVLPSDPALQNLQSIDEKFGLVPPSDPAEAAKWQEDLLFQSS